jgi:type IV pilus assembly protein PilC
MIYRYQACRSDKQIVSGTIEAETENMAEQALYEAGFQYVLSLKNSLSRPSLYKLIPSLFGVKTSDIIEFSRQLATFMASGSSLSSSLQLMEGQATKPALKEVISGLNREVLAGKLFSEALKKYPQAFPRFYWQNLVTSEKTGNIETGLKQVADFMEARAAISNKVKRAMAYPLFVVLLSFGVMGLLVTLVLPPLLKLFESFQSELPFATRAVIASASFVSDFKIQLFLAVIAVIAVTLTCLRVPLTRVYLERMVLRLPVVGRIVLYRNLGNFCSTASMLLAVGLPLTEIMDVIIENTAGNLVFTEAVTRLKDRLVQGDGLAKPMAENSLFPGTMANMVATGEHTGTFDSVFGTLASYYERQTDQRIKSLVGLIEPALTVVIGLMVALMLFSIIMPIYQIVGRVR